jgi:hypothetical protein
MLWPTRQPATCTRIACYLTFLPCQPLGQQDTCVADAGQILIELSTGIQLYGARTLRDLSSENLYNVVRQASREMSEQYLDRRMTCDCIG